MSTVVAASALPAKSGGTFRSLGKYRNFRIFFGGQLVSIAGTWMQATAQSWLVFKILHAGAGALGVMFGLQFTPALFLGAWFGVLVDRYDKRRLVVVAQSIMLVSASTLAVLTLSGHIRLWMVFACAMVNGTANVLDNPARQGLTVEMVGRDDLTNALGITTMMFNMGRVVGPAMAGFLLQLGVTPGWCFVVNALSFVAVIGALLAMRPDELHVTPVVERQRGQIREGLRYVAETPLLRRLLLGMLVISLFAMNQNVVLPVLATKTFHAEAGLFGLFSAAQGAGAIVAGYFTARRRLPPQGFVAASCVGLAVAMTLAAVSPGWAYELAAMFLVGVSLFTFLGCVNPNLSLGADPEKRGRVMALNSMIMFGSTAVGAPTAGWFVRHFGPRFGLLTGAIAAAVVAVGLLVEPLREAAASRASAALPGRVPSVTLADLER